MRPADRIDNVKPRLHMKKMHKEEKDATFAYSGTVWGI